MKMTAVVKGGGGGKITRGEEEKGGYCAEQVTRGTGKEEEKRKVFRRL